MVGVVLRPRANIEQQVLHVFLLKEGDRFRLSIELGEVTEKRKGWVEAIFLGSIEIDGAPKPACVAECVFRFLPAQS